MTNWPINYDPVFGCYLWAAKLDRDGYGISWRGRLATRAHIAVYREQNGPDSIPEGFVLDHDCRRRNCVNPDHLEPVTQSENEFRKSWRYRAKRTHCKNGHELAEHGMQTPEGGRPCRACRNENEKHHAK